MLKKVVCVIVAAVMVIMMLPVGAVFAADASQLVVSEENGYNYISLDPVEADFLGASSQRKLAKPTNLRWNYDEYGKKKNGYFSWVPVANCEGEYEITVYCNGVEKSYANWSDLYDYDGLGRISVEFVNDDTFNESGKYTFSVKAVGDGERYSDSEVAVSGEYNFVCPSKKLSVPTNISWVEDGVIKHKPVENAAGYKYEVYDQNKNSIGYTWDLSGNFEINNGYIKKDLSWYIRDLAGWEPDVKELYVTVRALTPDIERYQNSEKSKFSGKYDIASGKSDIGSALDSVMGSLNNNDITATEALDSFLGDMEINEVSNLDLAVSMQQDSGIVDSISELEQKFCEETGISVGVSDVSSDTGYLEDRGIDVEKISVVGAALNSQDGQDVDINFSGADDLSVDELFYKNSVSVNIGIDGVKDNKKLDVPIQIKMPSPSGVVPQRLIILHYHADGSVETIHPAVSYEGGEAYISFVLTSFSPFVFCNSTGFDCVVSNEAVGETEFSCDLYLSDAYLGKMITALIAFYDESDRLVQVKSSNFTYEGYEISIGMDYNKEDYSYYKFFIVEDYKSLKPLNLQRQ